MAAMTAGAAYPAHSNRARRVASLLLSMLALAVLLAWAVTMASRGRAVWAGLALPMILAMASLAPWRSQPEGQLAREAVGWRFQPAAAGETATVGELVVAVDLGGWMLLRLRTEGACWRTRDPWLAVSQRDMAGTWHAFRRAVYSPRPSPAGLAAQAPADPPA
ncbi:hypothetical protein FSC37_03400 [Piscinibacter aquaticus]|uniref:Toxin CptA n=1 Tax=Piscinibacter aquaticus TaxID=392597 RepID=A0A5C6TY88_9BURK|nr:hypothetical protein FSC37_03400 [Piscinibacter aquaticus]